MLLLIIWITITAPLNPTAPNQADKHCSWKKSHHPACLPTLQYDEAQHPVQVDLLIVALQERCCPGEAAQDVIDHLRPRHEHCGKQSQHCGQLVPRDPHVLTRGNVLWRRLREYLQGVSGRTAENGQGESGEAGNRDGNSCDVREAAVKKSKLLGADWPCFCFGKISWETTKETQTYITIQAFRSGLFDFPYSCPEICRHKSSDRLCAVLTCRNNPLIIKARRVVWFILWNIKPGGC